MERHCRLCWTTINGNNFEVIGEIEREMLEILSLKLSLSPSEDTIVCSCCVEELEKSFQFKATCLYTEDYIFPLFEQHNKLDMRQIYNNDQENAINIAYDENVCRLCMEVYQNGSFSTLKEVDENMLQKCIPDVNLTATQQTLFCNFCLASLTRSFNFMRQCFETEEKIKAFCKNDINDSNFPEKFESQSNQFTKGKKRRLFRVVRSLENNIKDDCKPEDGSNQNSTTSVTNQSKLQLYYCEKCNFMTRYRKSIGDHVLIHVDPSQLKMFTCEICPYQSKFKNNVRKHSRIHQGKYKCIYCSYQSGVISAFKIHLHNIHKDKSLGEMPLFKCLLCSYETIRRTNFTKHMKTHRNSGTKFSNCITCGGKYNKRFLKKHKRTCVE